MAIQKAAFIKFLRDNTSDEDLVRLWNQGHLALIDVPSTGAAAAPKNGHAKPVVAAAAKKEVPKPKLLPLDKVEGLVLKALAKGGLGAGAIAAKSGGNQGQVVRVVRKLETEGKVFRAGERRHTRYALTQDDANAANAAAETKEN